MWKRNWVPLTSFLPRNVYSLKLKKTQITFLGWATIISHHNKFQRFLYINKSVKLLMKPYHTYLLPHCSNIIGIFPVWHILNFSHTRMYIILYIIYMILSINFTYLFSFYCMHWISLKKIIKNVIPTHPTSPEKFLSVHFFYLVVARVLDSSFNPFF